MGDLAERMLVYRARHRLSQAKFAEMCGLSLQTVNSVENGTQQPSKMTVVKIEFVLNEKEDK